MDGWMDGNNWMDGRKEIIAYLERWVYGWNYEIDEKMKLINRMDN